jgi:hypothetical protein
MGPRQELADDLCVALPAFAKPASAGEGRPASGLERDVTESGTKAIFAPSSERGPKRKRGPAADKSLQWRAERRPRVPQGA